MSKGICHMVCPQGRHNTDLPWRWEGGGRSGFVCPPVTCGGVTGGMGYFGTGGSA